MAIPIFQKEILVWYSKNKRDLPWRKTTEPYKILVSELMLQQTQVNRVIPIYDAFLKTWPDLDSLAKAELGDVLRAWKGLGYNRRAKFLWELSRHPSNILLYRKLAETDLPELRKLPGIGHYTAAAIAAFAHNADALVVDTNIRRIHQRYFGDASDVTIRSTAPKGRSRDWHNALMDFGSLVCTKAPKCTVCPLKATCVAYAKQDFAVAVPKQSTFKESNRFYRGKIIDALRSGPMEKAALEALGNRAPAALATLEKEGLIRRDGIRYKL